MSAFDLIIFLVMATFIAVGILRGFIRSIMSLFNWMIAGVVAWSFAGQASVLFNQAFTAPMPQLIASFTVLFAIAYLIGAGISVIITNLIDGSRFLKLPNQVLGGVLGAVSSLLLIIFAVLLMGLTTAPQQKWWKQSATAPSLAQAALFFADFLPKDVSKHIKYD